MKDNQRYQLFAYVFAVFTLTLSTTSIAAAQAMPVNYRQTAGVAQAGGILHFDYAWDSSTGNLADLNNCQVGENVDYPGGRATYTFSSPPYAANCTVNNPTVLWVAGQNGTAQDNHSHCPFLAPYQADQLTATQAYQWRCTNINMNQITVFAGWNNIAIVRTVANTMRMPMDPCWFYSITKSGLEAQVRPLPGAGPCPAANNRAQLGLPEASDGAGAAASFSLPNQSVGLHEPVVLDFEVQNLEAEPVHFDLGLNRAANFEVTVTDPSGATTTSRLSSAGFGSSGEVSLEPGDDFKHTLLLNEWNSFAVEGTYKVSISLLGSIVDSNGKVVADQPSGEFYVQVASRNAEQLSQISSQLADEAIGGASMKERMDAAQTLSYVNDSLAVPQLISVLSQGTFVEQYAVEGLGRIGSSEAVSALWGAVGHSDPGVRSLVWFTLNQLSTHGDTNPKALD